jgi:hypothetical protein
MSFDDRPAYRETHSHAVGLGGEESIEDTVDIATRKIPELGLRHRRSVVAAAL